jgi:hypothetical protein
MKQVKIDEKAHEILRRYSFEKRKQMGQVVSELIYKHLPDLNPKKEEKNFKK